MRKTGVNGVYLRAERKNGVSQKLAVDYTLHRIPISHQLGSRSGSICEEKVVERKILMI